MSTRSLKNIVDLPSNSDPGDLHENGLIGASLSGEHAAVVKVTRRTNRLYHTATTSGWVDLPDHFHGDYEVLSVSRDRVMVSGVYDPPEFTAPRRYVFILDPDGRLINKYEDTVEPNHGRQVTTLYNLQLAGEEMPICLTPTDGWQFAELGSIPGYVRLAAASPDGSCIILVYVPKQPCTRKTTVPTLKEAVVIRPGPQNGKPPFYLPGCSVERMVLARFEQFRVHWVDNQPAIRFIEHFENDNFCIETQEWFVSEDAAVALDGSDDEWTSAVFHNHCVYYVQKVNGQSILVCSGEKYQQLDQGDRIWNLRLAPDGRLTYNLINDHSIQHVRQQV